jgi:hypothetical protein
MLLRARGQPHMHAVAADTRLPTKDSATHGGCVVVREHQPLASEVCSTLYDGAPSQGFRYSDHGMHVRKAYREMRVLHNAEVFGKMHTWVCGR